MARFMACRTRRSLKGALEVFGMYCASVIPKNTLSPSSRARFRSAFTAGALTAVT